jgi:hypothetical protein
MTSNSFPILRRARKWWNRKSAENRDAFILDKLQDEAKKRLKSPDSEKPVLFFNASTRLEGMSLNSAFAILTSISLRKQGVNTIHWICYQGMTHCVLGTERTNILKRPPCSACIKQSNKTYKGASTLNFEYQPDVELAKKLKKMNFKELIEFESDGIPFGSLIFPSLRWILRVHHIEGNDSELYLFMEYILSAENIARQFINTLKRIHPRAIVLFNGQFFPEAVVRHVSIREGIRVITHEVGMQPLSAFFTEGEATAYPVKIPDRFLLNSAQEKVLDDYLQQRFQGDFSMAGIRFWPKIHGLDEDFVKKANEFKQIVPIFTNVIFDTSQGHANVLFSDMFAWLETVLSLIKRHSDTYFVIRAHPDEGRPGKESHESVADWVRKNKIEQLPNVKFVDSNEYFSSYELIEKSKFVMVYNSTIGLEASILGKTVLCGGKARYTQYPTVLFPRSKKEFEQTGQELLDSKVIETPARYPQNARRFLYFQLFATSLSFSSFLKPDPEWRGYVHFKKFEGKMLDPETNPLFKIVSDGILNSQPFLNEVKEVIKEEKG